MESSKYGAVVKDLDANGDPEYSANRYSVISVCADFVVSSPKGIPWQIDVKSKSDGKTERVSAPEGHILREAMMRQRKILAVKEQIKRTQDNIKSSEFIIQQAWESIRRNESVIRSRRSGIDQDYKRISNIRQGGDGSVDGSRFPFKVEG